MMNEELKYPVGIQTFSKLIEGGFAYVDKTQYIKPIVDNEGYYFLSRPRRFGKSLLLSTLHSFFDGKRELFKGLAIDSMDVDWTPAPVLHFDFNSSDYRKEDGLEAMLSQQLDEMEEVYGCETKYSDAVQRFRQLIRAAYEKTGRKVVILIDEYDKPLLSLDEKEPLYERYQSTLKGFFGNLKSMDRFIRLAFLTGVAHFNRVSIFSDLNNLKDISLVDRFADICGWTEEEMLRTFRSGIENLARKRKEDFETTLRELRNYYDGYLFTSEGSRLYNPYSVLLALDNQKFNSYWFATGTPTFIAKRIKKAGTFPLDLNGRKCTPEDLTAVGLNDRNPIPLMFQTGYLTIWKYSPEANLYELRFPNYEVESGFYRELLQVYAPLIYDVNSPFQFGDFKMDLYEGNIDDFMHRLEALFKDLPGEDHNESAYRAITYLLTVLSGTRAVAEHHGYLGRSDIEVQTSRFIYVFEFKYNHSVREAIDQLLSRDYAGRFAMDTRQIFIIGANYTDSRSDRALRYEIRKIR